MKLITAALARAGLVSSANLTEESAIVAEFETNQAKNAGLQTENTRLKAENDAFRNERKARVTAKVDKLVTDKLVKADRKDALVAIGERSELELDNYIADISEARTAANPQGAGGGAGGSRRTPPVNLEKAKEKTGEEKTDAINALLDEMNKSETTAERRAECVAELRTLRGRGNLFDKDTTQTPAK